MPIYRGEEQPELLRLTLNERQTGTERLDVQANIFVFVQVLGPQTECADRPRTPDAMKYRQRVTSTGKVFDTYWVLLVSLNRHAMTACATAPATRRPRHERLQDALAHGSG
jgi:hypothetical protein